MLVEPQGSDAFDDLEAEAEGNPLRKALRKLGPSTAKAVSTGLIPAAAVVGFLVTPGGKVVSAVGAAVTGLAGTLAKRKLGDESKAAAPAAVAELLQSKGLTNVRPADITAVLATYGVQGDEASDLLVDVYRRFLLAMCKGSATKAADIRELRDLRQALGLDGEQIGTAHYEASTMLYRERVLFTPEEELADEYNPARRALDKFLFLADRMFEVSDTEEAYEYEMGRIRKVFGLDAADVKARCLAIARPFYAKALDAAAVRLDTLRPGALELAEKTLGITDVMRDEMHLEAYRAEARALLEGTKLKDGAVERLGKLGNALKLDEEQQRQELEAVTVPVYEAAVARELEQALEATNEDPDTARRQSALRSGRLASMQLGLSLSADTSARVLQSSVRNAASTHFIAAAKFVRVGNNAKALEAAKELVAFVKAASGLVEKAFGLEEGEDPVRKIFQGSMVDDLSRKEGGQLYRIYLNAALAGQTALTDEQAADLKTLARLMGQGASEVQRAYQEATGPLLRKALEDSIEDGGYGADAKARNEALVKGLGIPKAVVSEQLKDLYFQRLKAVAGYGTIMTQAQRDDLHKLQDFLGLDQDTVDGLHRLVCAPAYQQSILESMGAAGVITPELRDALEVLRKRLGLTQSHARELLHAAARAKMKPMVEQLCYEFERTYLSKEQLAQRRGRDQGDDVLVSGNDAGDLGIVTTGAVNSDTLALVDFYLDNELPVVENGVTYYPVTAEGLGPAPLLERLYQQFVVAAFGVEGETAARYQAAQAPLAGILGIPREKVSSVHAEIGSTVLNQFFTAQLARGATSLGARETAFLASIGSKLGLPDADYDALVTSVKRRVLTYKAETAFQKPVFSVEMARNLRETAAGLGLELSRDVGLSQERLKKLFVTEAGAALEGEGGEGGVEEIEEVAEACGLGEDEAQAILGGMLRERAEAAIKDAASDVKASRDARVVASVTRLLSYCRLAGGLEVELRLADHVCESIYGTYMASRTASNEEEEAKLQEDGAMLRTVLGLKQPVSA